MSACEFPLTFPFTLGGCGYTPAETELEGTGLAWIASHCEDGKSLLLWQFQGKPRLEAMLCALLRTGVQDLDDAAWQVLTESWLDTAVGVQLDNIGAIVDLGRRGWTDAVYRTMLSAQILVLRSSGAWPELLTILETIGFTLALASVEDLPPAAGRVVLGEPFGAAITEDDAFELLERARPAAVRFDMEFPTGDVSEAFTWADGDVEQADTSRGWADDSPITYGGYWADVRSTEETS